MDQAIESYLSGNICRAIVREMLVKDRMKASKIITTVANRLGCIEDDVAEDMQNRIDNIQNDLCLSIQILKAII